FVANFIGTPPMNFVRCTVTEAGGLLSAKSFALPPPPGAKEALAPRAGKTVIVGLRPENVVGEGSQTHRATPPLQLTADLVETLGNEIVVHGKNGDDQISFKMDPHSPPALGAKVRALVELERLHLFDADTEKRIAY